MKMILILSLFSVLALSVTGLVSWNGNCIRDSSDPRLLPFLPGNDLIFPSLTPAKCIEACKAQNYNFAGVQYGTECWCGNDAPPEDRIVDMDECNQSCSGDSAHKCGATWRMNVYRIVSWNGNCVRDSSPPRLLPTNAVPGSNLIWGIPNLTPAICIEACEDQGFLFAGVQTGHECWCGNAAPREDRIVDMGECNQSCSGDSAHKCGGVWRMNVYRIGGCPSGWVGFSDNCYQWNSQKLTWSDAREFCNNHEADLVSIHSDLENNFISYQLSPKKQRFWIGTQRKATGSTEWLWTDGSSFDYENFCQGRPDNWLGNQDCLDIGYTWGSQCSRDTWDDQPCDHQLPFVCKLTKK